MEIAKWRHYRGHLIIVRKSFLGLRRYDIWKGGRLLETFRDPIAAELHVDSLLRTTARPQ